MKATEKLQQAIWVFLVSLLASKEEKSVLLKIFEKLDLNGDGKLNKEELKLGFQNTMDAMEAEKEVDRIMNEVDTNRSGEIDYSGILIFFCCFFVKTIFLNFFTDYKRIRHCFDK